VGKKRVEVRERVA